MRHRMQLVALGDSVTVGVGFSGVDSTTCYIELLRTRLTQCGLAVDLVPSALEGIDTGYAARRFNRMVTAFEPDLVTVMLGLNDMQPPGAREAVAPEEYRRNLLGLVDRILAIDARPVLATPSPRWDLAPHDPRSRLDPYVELVEQVAQHFQLGCVDVFSRFCQHQHRWPELIPDGIHPGPTGHHLIADCFARTLVPLLGGELVVQEADADVAGSTRE